MTRFVKCFAAVLLLSWAGSASADMAAGHLAETEFAGPRNTVTVNPLGLLVGAFNIEFERAVSPNVSWFVGPQYFASSSDTVADESVISVGLSGGVRWFFAGRAPAGWFISPNLSLAYAEAEVDGIEGSALAYSLGAIGGYTWLLGDVVDISLGLGAQYMSAEVDVEGISAGFRGVLPSGRLALGVAF